MQLQNGLQKKRGQVPWSLLKNEVGYKCFLYLNFTINYDEYDYYDISLYIYPNVLAITLICKLQKFDS